METNVNSEAYTFQPIGIVHSCFPVKFGIPRQPGLVKEARATLELLPPYDRAEALLGLDEFSHIWLVFVFHASMKEDWKATVRPPRLGGNQRVGVFASRSMFRPNPIGLSVVELDRIEIESGRPRLHLKGVDLMDGTPVLDIKPYLPYVDAVADARGAYAVAAPNPALQVRFSKEALQQCQLYRQQSPELQTLITRLLELDPRPAYYNSTSQRTNFGTRLLDFEVKWEVSDDHLVVQSIERVVQ